MNTPAPDPDPDAQHELTTASLHRQFKLRFLIVWLALVAAIIAFALIYMSNKTPGAVG